MHQYYSEQDFDNAIRLAVMLKGFEIELNDYYDMWIDRCEFMKTQFLPEDWDGIFRATTK